MHCLLLLMGIIDPRHTPGSEAEIKHQLRYFYFCLFLIFLLILLHYGSVLYVRSIIPTAMLAAEVHAQISMATGGSTKERHRSVGPSSFPQRCSHICLIPTLIISHSGGSLLNLPWMLMKLQLISRFAEKIDVIDEVEGT